MNRDNIILQMRESLVPKGTKPVVRLFLKDASFFNYEFITGCIDEINKRSLIVKAELDEFTPLEKLAMHVLFDSAYIAKPHGGIDEAA
jgi:hypothetical protein